jgi:hypothetical protein
MKFSITEIETKTGKSGATFYSATFREESEEGTETKATSFDLLDKKIGDVVEGELIKNGQYTNFKIHKEVKAGGFGGNSANIAKMQEKKNENINKIIDRKEDSFKVSATFRDATILTQTWSAKAPFPTSQEIEEKWVYFRRWLWEHYDMDITDTKAF